MVSTSNSNRKGFERSKVIEVSRTMIICDEILGFVPNWYQNNHQKHSNPADPITISKFLKDSQNSLVIVLACKFLKHQ